MIRRTLLIQNKPGLDAQAVERLEEVLRQSRNEIPGVMLNSVARNLRRSEASPWTHAWDFTLRDVDVVQTYRPHPYHENVIKPAMHASNAEGTTYIYFDPVRHCSSGTAGPFKHSLLLDFQPGTTEAQIADLDRRFVELANDAPGKPNWGIGKVVESVPGSSWARIWEFEFAKPEDFAGYWDKALRENLRPALAPQAGPVKIFTEVQVQPEVPFIRY